MRWKLIFSSVEGQDQMRTSLLRICELFNEYDMNISMPTSVWYIYLKLHIYLKLLKWWTVFCWSMCLMKPVSSEWLNYYYDNVRFLASLWSSYVKVLLYIYQFRGFNLKNNTYISLRIWYCLSLSDYHFKNPFNIDRGCLWCRVN